MAAARGCSSTHYLSPDGVAAMENICCLSGHIPRTHWLRQKFIMMQLLTQLISCGQLSVGGRWEVAALQGWRKHPD